MEAVKMALFPETATTLFQKNCVLRPNSCQNFSRELNSLYNIQGPALDKVLIISVKIANGWFVLRRKRCNMVAFT